MLQQVMTNPGEIIFREVPVPEIKDNQVLVKIMNIGICGSDIHVYHGKHPFTKYPVTQGHEVSGEVVKTGDAVTEFHVGQKVTIEPQVYCGHCYPCRHGKYNLCEELKVMGFQTTGTASEYFAVDASKVTPIPEDMSYEEGAMIEPLAVAVHGVKQMGDVTGMNIVVIGAGPIGNLVAQSAKGMGAAKVMINGYGFLFVAGFTATNKLYGLLEMAAISYGYAIVTYVGQNLGARKIDRIRKGVRSSMLLSLLTSLIISAAMFLFGKNILSLFISGEPQQTQQVLAIAFKYLSIMAAMLWVLYFLYVYRSVLQGLGDTLMPMVSGMTEFAMRISAALILPHFIGRDGVFFAEVTAWSGATVILCISYYVRMHKYH